MMSKDEQENMRIAILSENLVVGGINRYCLDLMKGLSFYPDVEPYLFAPGHKENVWLVNQAKIAAVRLRVINGTQVEIVKGLVKQLLDFDIQILHTQGFHSNVLGRLAVKVGGLNVKLVNTVHGAYYFCAAEPLARIYFSLDYLSMFLTDKIITVSDATARQIRWLGLTKRTSTIHNGTAFPVNIQYKIRQQIRRQLGIPEDWKVACFIGRLSREKGVKNLMDVINQVLKFSSNIAFVVVGDGEMRIFLEDTKREFPQNVFLLGYRPDVSSIYQASDLLVLPSLSEGLPMVVLEALAYGLPVVAHNVGGVSEVVVDGYNGFLCNTWNAEDVGQKIIVLLSDDHTLLEFGKNAIKTVENDFTIQGMVSKTYNLYRELL